MAELQNIQNLPPLAKSLQQINLTYTPNPSYTFTSQISGPTTVYKSVEHEELPILTEYKLVNTARLLAIMLVHTLNQLRNYNEEAVRSIVSFIEPHKNVNPGLVVRMAPKSSREVSIEVTKRGKAKPRASLD